MSFQRNVLLIFCLFASVGLSAQSGRFNQSFGLAGTTSTISGSAIAKTDTSIISSDYRLRLLQFGIVYTPRMDLVGTKAFSISIASPIMVGMSGSGKYRSVDFNGTKRDTVEKVRGSSLMFEIPLIAELNIGLHSAADDSKNNLGLYIGGGYLYNYTKIKTSVGKLPYDKFEPVFRAGLRMGQRWETRWSIAFTMRGNFQSNATRTYGLQLLKEL